MCVTNKLWECSATSALNGGTGGGMLHDDATKSVLCHVTKMAVVNKKSFCLKRRGLWCDWFVPQMQAAGIMDRDHTVDSGWLQFWPGTNQLSSFGLFLFICIHFTQLMLHLVPLTVNPCLSWFRGDSGFSCQFDGKNNNIGFQLAVKRCQWRRVFVPLTV